MSKTITSAPESITRADYIEMIRAAGFEPEDVHSLRFAIDGIYAEVFARGEDGQFCIGEIPGEDTAPPAMHTVFVPVEG
jgi:hypothetical protein